jgi:hypothetical protein
VSELVSAFVHFFRMGCVRNRRNRVDPGLAAQGMPEDGSFKPYLGRLCLLWPVQ